MKCGYCKNEMIKGVIPTPAIEWHPDNRTSKLSYDNGSRFLSCFVYRRNAYFTDFRGIQSFCLVS